LSVAGIYLDHNASTPIAAEVLAVMQPLLSDHWGNPSSGHWASVGAASALVKARAQVASLLGASGDEVVFTSGGSEANNHAIKGTVFRHLRDNRGSNPHIIICTVEHPAVREPCRWLEAFGARVSEVPVDRHGLVSASDVQDEMTPDTVLVSIMHANNEVGSIQDIAAIARVAHAGGALMHTDAAQSVGKVATKVDALEVDLLTIAGHKLYAPKGIGALYIRRGVALESLIHGAGHEGKRRAGTENVAFAAGLGAACALAEQDPCGDRLAELRDQFWTTLQQAFGDAVIRNGHPTKCLPNTLNVSFVGKLSPEILDKLDGVAASTGSACDASSRSMSPVLAAMGTEESVGLGAIRFSLGRANTRADVDRVVAMLREIV
jgi:cysteine desulfurase